MVPGPWVMIGHALPGVLRVQTRWEWSGNDLLDVGQPPLS